MTVGSELDLRFTGSLDPDASVVFNELARGLRGSFNDVIAGLSQSLGESLDWWVEGPASRNTYASPLFHHYCALHLVRRLIDDGRFPYRRVLVDSRAMQMLLTQLLRDSGISDRLVVCTAERSVKRSVKRRVGTPVLALRQLCQWVLARTTRSGSDKRVPNRPLVLVDTFMMPGYTASDRWYGRLWSSLTGSQAAATFFVPTLVLTPLRRARATFRELRTADRSFVIKEDYLQFSDFTYAAGHRRRIRRLAVPAVLMLGYDIAPLVREELTENRDPLSPLDALLTYRFVRRLRERGVQVRLAVDWFEGHGIDKAWNLAFHHFYPETDTIGYRAFESFSFYLSTYPTQHERAAGVIPDAFAVQGPASVESIREFLPDLDVVIVPALRAQWVWEFDDHRPQAGEFTVLAALPISHIVSVRIIDQVLEARERTRAAGMSVRYVIKRHPATRLSLITEHLPARLPDDVTFSDEPSFPKLLAGADLLVSEASSVCLEALACGVPVVVMENDGGLTYDPMPNAIPHQLYCRVRSGDALADAVTHYAQLGAAEREQQRSSSRDIRRGYFEPLTSEGIDRFMRVSRAEETANV